MVSASKRGWLDRSMAESLPLWLHGVHTGCQGKERLCSSLGGRGLAVLARKKDKAEPVLEPGLSRGEGKRTGINV